MSETTMRAAVCYGKGDMRLEDVPRPLAQPGWAVLEVFRTGICGTELRAYATDHSHVSFPVVMGHEVAGTVVELGDGVESLRVGDRVAVAPIGFCGQCVWCRQGLTGLCDTPATPYSATNGGFAEYMAAPSHLLFRVPDQLSLQEAATTEPTAVAYHATRRAGLTLGQSILVVGAGPIGLAIVQVAAAAGASPIIVSEPATARREAARRLGASVALNPARDDLAGAVRDATGGSGVDIAFEAVGAQPALDLALKSLRKRGVAIVVGGRGELASVDLGGLLRREVELRLAFACGAYDEFPAVLRMMADKVIDASKAISDEIPLDDIVPRGFDELLANKNDHLKILVNPQLNGGRNV